MFATFVNREGTHLAIASAGGRVCDIRTPFMLDFAMETPACSSHSMDHGVVMPEPCKDMFCSGHCDDAVDVCHECDPPLGCSSDTTICYDPHCAMPPCDHDHITSSLTFGVLPCTYPATVCCTLPHDNDAMMYQGHDPLAASMNGMSMPCTYDSCETGMDTSCLHHVPHSTHWPACDQSSRCVSVCDGFVTPTPPPYPSSGTGSIDMNYACQLLESTCQACTSTDPLACHAVSTNVAPSLVSMTPNSMTPTSSLLHGSDGPGSSDTSCSTPSSNTYPISPQMPDTSMIQFPCRWAGCQGQMPTLEELALHVQKFHLHPSATTQDPAAWHDTQNMAASMSSLLPGPTTSSSALTPSTPMPISTAPNNPLPSEIKLDLTEHFREAEALLQESHTACLCPPAQEGRKRHPCGWIHCTESFDTHAELTAHITALHVGSGKTEYECGWVGCPRAQEGRKFSQKQKVLRHIQTHTGDRPYVCPECHKRFSEANTLTQHMRTHTNERPYKCDFPGCNKSFSVVGSLTIHKRTHTGDRPFKCPYPGCGKQFSESSNLNKHIRVHRGDKPFKCPECDRRFTRPDQMARHRKVHAKAAVSAAAAHATATSTSNSPAPSSHPVPPLA